MPLALYLPAGRYAGPLLTERIRIWLVAWWRDMRPDAQARADRQHLLEIEERLLTGAGLTHEDVRRGVPFQRRGREQP